MAKLILQKDVLYPAIKFGFAALIGFLGFYQYSQLVQAKHTTMKTTTIFYGSCVDEEPANLSITP